MAADAVGAEAATLGRSRNGRGTTNTVLLCTVAELNALVLASDWDAAVHLNGPVWLVTVSVNHVKQRAAQGANGSVLLDAGNAGVGAVKLKVYFDEPNQRISVTGVSG